MTLDTFKEEYENLPESIKQVYSFKEYQTLTESDRAHLVEDETTPEWEEP